MLWQHHVAVLLSSEEEKSLRAWISEHQSVSIGVFDLMAICYFALNILK